MTAPTDRLLELAVHRLSQGDLHGAVELLRQALATDPESALAHALLALALVDLRRVHAAEVEARLALTGDPELPLARRALAAVMVARRRFREAREHVEQAIAHEPHHSAHHRALADIQRLQGDPRAARATLEKARGLDPDDPDAMVDLGELDLEDGRFEGAEWQARQALSRDAEHLSGLVLMGRVLLRRGDVAAAREHAHAAVRINPASRAALGFLTEVKARQSRLLGTWWRWNAWMNALGDGRAITVLLGAYVLYRVSTILIQHSSRPHLAQVVSLAWLGAVAYTWVGPSLFHRMLRRELADVKLDDRF